MQSRSKLDFSRELIGRRVLVTGGARAMGAAIAQRLLDAGAKVVVTGRSRGDATAAGAIFIAGDVSSVEGVKAVAVRAHRGRHRVDPRRGMAGISGHERTRRSRAAVPCAHAAE